MTVRVHLDTDLGGNPDDVCALAYLLARPDVELVGITTVDDPGGSRAGLVAEVLAMAGRTDVPVAAGAEVSLTDGSPSSRPVPRDPRYWPSPATPAPGPFRLAVGLLASSVRGGAVLVGIGPATSLALAERSRPGLLGLARVVLMGGWVAPPGPGLPPWTPAEDWNVVRDVVAASEVRRAAGRLTVVPLAGTAQAHLRTRDLDRLRAGGPLGSLMARQAAAYRDDTAKPALARAHPGLPADLANFHHDPLTAAVAVGWPGAAVASRRLRTAPGDPHARLEPADPGDPLGRDTEVVEAVDGPGFAAHWLATVAGPGRDVRT